MKKIYLKYQLIFNILFVFLGILFFITLWEISALIIDEFNIFPTFFQTLTNLFDILGDIRIYQSIGISLGISLLSILISTICAIIFGIISGLFKVIRMFLSPFIAFFKTIPTVCIVILLIILSKDIMSYIVIVFLVIFPIIYEATVKGISNIDDNIILSLRMEGLYTSNSLLKVILPLSFPYINGGLNSAIGIGVKVEIMAEILIGSSSIHGLGYLIHEVRAVTFNYIDIYSYVLIIVFLFLIIDLLLYFIKKIKLFNLKL